MASFAHKLVAISAEDQEENLKGTHFTYDPNVDTSKPVYDKQHNVEDFQSGTDIQKDMYVAIVDTYGQIVRTFFNDAAIIKDIDPDPSKDPIVLANNTKRVSYGIYNLKATTITLQPKSIITLYLSSPLLKNIPNTNTEFSNIDEKLAFTVQARSCRPGEIKEATGACYECGSNVTAKTGQASRTKTYSLNPNDQECQS
eukprot:CAMPEP_0115006404 /NCGR_PEP_ID=MMETSP0216-20121206/20486_1 /TAXON_ID=223996 /ORGANISM="Protocruzia adherens, Strain Boccale" /LENGTH=198 /DNA_ID=CAMNT_0002372993 /DNA_START=112 /DNA_END=705 /DNA_ORIENTATION=-